MAKKTDNKIEYYTTGAPNYEGKMGSAIGARQGIRSSSFTERDSFTLTDFYSSLEDNPLPKDHFSIMQKCSDIYKRDGIIRNIIDLMTDFTNQGIRISHPVPSIQRLYRRWFKKVKGPSVSERFCRYLYKFANVVLQKSLGRLKASELEKLKAVGARNIIPYKYTFINPKIVKVEGEELSCFLENPQYYIEMAYQIDTGETPLSSILKKLPENIRKAISKGAKYPLDQALTEVYFYRREDWDPWATPILYSIFKDLDIVERMQMADRAALAGASRKIRAWKIGSLEYELSPLPAAYNRLEELMRQSTSDGVVDIIWGPDLELIESNSESFQYLGKEKFIPYMEKIYQGLGIPSTLAGTQGGSTNNFISLKTLIQRLEYGRTVLKEFWERQIEDVQEALQISKPATVEFDYPNLTDDAAHKALLIQLADRNLISDELIQRAFWNDPELEKVRISRDYKDRSKGTKPHKQGPYGLDFDQTLLKTAYEKGFIKLEDALDGRQEIDEIEQPVTEGQNGRPMNSKDKQKRKTRQFKPVGSVSHQIWATREFSSIGEALKPLVLSYYGKKTLRELTNEQTKYYDDLRVSILFNMAPFSKIDIKQALATKPNSDTLSKYYTMCNDVSEKVNRPITLEEKAQIAAFIYSLDYEALQTRTSTCE